MTAQVFLKQSELTYPVSNSSEFRSQLMQSILSRTLCPILTSMLLFVGCSKSQSASVAVSNENRTTQQAAASPNSSVSNHATAASSPTKGRIDACSLLTAEDVKSVQGEAFKETKASEGSDNGMVVAQCFFSLPTFANSVNLAVMQKGEGSGVPDPREFFEKTFASRAESEREKEREKRERKSAAKSREEEEKEGSAAQKVEGVGDEAFWTGNRVGGALYVLKHDAYIRVSIGGAGDQKTRIEKSKALARLALKRLS